MSIKIELFDVKRNIVWRATILLPSDTHELVRANRLVLVIFFGLQRRDAFIVPSQLIGTSLRYYGFRVNSGN